MFNANLPTEEFEVNEIFMDPQISLSVVKSPESEVLSMTPRHIYNEIKSLAEKRYNYTLLPKKLINLQSFDHTQNKLSLLRDICISTGIVLTFKKGQELNEFILDNDIHVLKKRISEVISQRTNASQANKKKNKGH